MFEKASLSKMEAFDQAIEVVKPVVFVMNLALALGNVHRVKTRWDSRHHGGIPSSKTQTMSCQKPDSISPFHDMLSLSTGGPARLLRPAAQGDPHVVTAMRANHAV